MNAFSWVAQLKFILQKQINKLNNHQGYQQLHAVIDLSVQKKNIIIFN